eukprot:2128462-Pyramimonas_sp.AAC.1
MPRPFAWSATCAGGPVLDSTVDHLLPVGALQLLQLLSQSLSALEVYVQPPSVTLAASSGTSMTALERPVNPARHRLPAAVRHAKQHG